MTFPAIQGLFRQFGNGTTYEALSNQPNIKHALRRYKKTGIQNPRTQNLSDILRRMAIPRIYPEHEIRRARQDFNQQAEVVPAPQPGPQVDPGNPPTEGPTE